MADYKLNYTGLQVNNAIGKVNGISATAQQIDNTVINANAFIEFTTIAPTQANAQGLKVVVLTSEPAVRYNGYIYFVTSNGGAV